MILYLFSVVLIAFYSCPSAMGNYHVIGRVCLCVCVSVCVSVNTLAPTIFEAESSYLYYILPMVLLWSLFKMVKIGSKLWPLGVKVWESRMSSYHIFLSSVYSFWSRNFIFVPNITNGSLRKPIQNGEDQVKTLTSRGQSLRIMNVFVSRISF